MRAAAWLFLAALALPAATRPQDGSAGKQSSTQPQAAPLEAVAGLAGFQSVSRMIFHGKEDLPHRLEVVHVFPDRARWHRSLVDAGPTERDIEYRYGSRAYRLPQSNPRSEELGPEETDQTLGLMELRRAVMLWPDGFDWKEEEREHRTPLRRSAGGESIGSIRAELDAEGRPLALRIHDPEGKEQVTLRIEDWFEAEERTWPAELVFEADGEPLWSETIESVSTRVRYLDVFFVPPDRRTRADSPGGVTILSLDIVPVTFLEVKLREGCPWERAFDELEGARLRAARKLGDGHELDPVATFELTPEGMPARGLLRLVRPVDPPPRGWSTRGERQGMALIGFTDVGQIDPDALAALARRAPAGSRAATPYVRIYEVAAGRRLHVLLPFDLAE